MSGGKVHRIDEQRKRRAARAKIAQARQRQRSLPADKPAQNGRSVKNGRSARKNQRHRKPGRRSPRFFRRVGLLFLPTLVGLALVLAVFVQSSGVADSVLPIDPNSAGPDTVLADAAGVEVSTPVRPADLQGLGYHPEGDSLLEMSPRGENLSANQLLRLVTGGDTREDIQYYVMDRAGREGPRTGALDVGAEAGTTVYAPVTGVVAAVMPDPTIDGANVVQIKPAADPGVLVSVSLVQDINGNVGPDAPVTAGITELGRVADSAAVLNPQLASYTGGSGNHVTVYAIR